MNNNNAIFLVGGPGSGKDFLLRTALGESGATEIPLTKLISAIQSNEDIIEIDGRPLVVNGNADDGQSVLLAKAVLEAMGYETAMIHVYTDEEASKTRSKIDESKRAEKYSLSCQNMHAYKDTFAEGFFLFDNSADFLHVNEETQAQTVRWIAELTELVEGYFEKPVNGIRAPKVPKPVGGAPEGGHHVPAGYERVKKGSFNVLRKKEVKEEVDVLFEKEFPTIVDMIAQKKVKGQSQGDKYKGGIAVPGDKSTSRQIVTSEGSNQEVKVTQTQVKGVKYSKNRPAKGAKPPGDTFDSRMGAVPSGGIGLTAYKEEITPKTFKDIRKK